MLRKYLWYVIRHKWFVFVECVKLGIWRRGLMHDMSKLRPSELLPYARYFYGDADKLSPLRTEDEFDVAWLKHQHRNPHHWQHWVLRMDDGSTRVMPMPRKYVMEMVADWRGAGMAIYGTDDTEAWFVRNRGNMMLHPATESIVVELLNEPKSVMESRRYAPKKRPLLDDMDQMRRYIEAINYLRQDEGSSVEIACDNPEGEPNATVRIAYMCPHEGRRWKGRRFTGSTVLEALELAAATRMKEYQDACKEDLNEETRDDQDVGKGH